MSARAASSMPRAPAERCAWTASTAPTGAITTAARSASWTSAAGGPSSSLLLQERLNSSSATPSTTAAIWDGRHTSLHTQLTKLEQDQQTRSEQHTSELQSLMRSSYAVFCLKKKTKNYETRTRGHNPTENMLLAIGIT